jgi:hypothetical protein
MSVVARPEALSVPISNMAEVAAALNPTISGAKKRAAAHQNTNPSADVTAVAPTWAALTAMILRPI